MRNSIAIVVCLLSFGISLFLPIQAQTLPRTGAMKWLYVGWDDQLERLDWIQAMHFVPDRNQVIIASKVSFGSPRAHDWGADIVTLDYETGREIDRKPLPCKLVQRDTIGELGEFTVTGMSMNDSGTVLCYKCRDEPWAVVRWPSMEPMNEIDTRSFAKEGSWLRISGDGRYYFINSLQRTVRINRLNGDTLRIPPCWWNGLDASGSVGIASGPALVNIDSAKTITGLGTGGTQNGTHFSLARNGSRVLVSTMPDSSHLIAGFHTVYDAHTGEKIWEIPRMTERSFVYITFDGDEVIVDGGNRYRIPDTEPWATTYPPGGTKGDENYQLLTRNEVLYFQKDDARVRRFRLDTMITSVHETGETHPAPVIYPNPGTRQYTVRPLSCTETLWDVSLYDVSGSIVASTTAFCTSNELIFELQFSTPGSYILQLATPSRSSAPISMQMVVQ